MIEIFIVTIAIKIIDLVNPLIFQAIIDRIIPFLAKFEKNHPRKVSAS
ncbi:hypothetical protein [Bartonella sp. ML71XJBT]|nr:hypothetical protein [Bartonella sp. ML71XJBT]